MLAQILSPILNLFATPVYAQCPVCVITVGGGLLIAKKLGIDDLLVSIWLSGLNTAIAFWIASKAKQRLLKSPVFMSMFLYGFTFVYLASTDQMGYVKNKFLGIDKVVFGMTVGLAAFFIAFFIDKLIRSKNNQKVLFPYQKVVIPVLVLTFTTLVFGILIKLL